MGVSGAITTWEMLNSGGAESATSVLWIRLLCQMLLLGTMSCNSVTMLSKLRKCGIPVQMLESRVVRMCLCELCMVTRQFLLTHISMHFLRRVVPAFIATATLLFLPHRGVDRNRMRAG